MTKEENNIAFKALEDNPKELDDKVKNTMLFIIRVKEKGTIPREAFHHLKETYTLDELALIASTHIGEKLAESLQNNPILRGAAQAIRHLDGLVDDFEKENG